MSLDKEKKLAEDIFFALLSPPVNEDGQMSDEQEQAWSDGINDMIRNKLEFCSLCELLILAQNHARTIKAFSMALKRHEVDPKQASKKQVKECWELWQKNPSRYNGKAAFARDMLSKYEDLVSQPVIEGWCRYWESSPS